MQVAVFHSRKLNKTLHLERERFVDVGGEVQRLIAHMVRFENGLYKTADEKEADLIRKTPAYRSKEVFEVSAEDVDAIKEAQQREKQGTIRGAITSQTIAQEAQTKLPEDKSMKIEEPSSAMTACNECGKEFPDDLGGKKLRMHKISAHRNKE